MAIRYFQRVVKVGNSLAVILPVEITRSLEIQRGDPIALAVLQSDVVSVKLLADFELKDLRVDIPTIEI